MNLHAIASQYVAVVNPWMTVQIQVSTGYTTNGDGTRVPAYDPSVPVQAQVQTLQYNDIIQLDSLNIQGNRLALYMTGDWNGIVRSDQKGGDVITLPDGSVWLAAVVLEGWSATAGWTKLAITTQNNS